MRVLVLGCGSSIGRVSLQALLASDLRLGVVCLEDHRVDIEAFGLCPTNLPDFNRAFECRWEPADLYCVSMCPVEFIKWLVAAIPLLKKLIISYPFFKEEWEDE